MKRYELAVIKRAFKLIFLYVKPGRIRLSADRGFPDDGLFALLDELNIDYIIRVKGSVKVFYGERWVKLNTIGFEGNARRRNLGRLYYCEKSPRQLWITMNRARNKKGKLETWYLVSNLRLRAKLMATEYGFRFCCEIVFTQMTKANFFTSRAGWDDIADFNFAVVDDHTVYEQFDQLSALGESELIQSWLQPLAECLDACSQRSRIQAPLRLGFLSLPKTSSRLEILVVRGIISHSARSSGSSFFR